MQKILVTSVILVSLKFLTKRKHHQSKIAIVKQLKNISKIFKQHHYSVNVMRSATRWKSIRKENEHFLPLSYVIIMRCCGARHSTPSIYIFSMLILCAESADGFLFCSCVRFDRPQTTPCGQRDHILPSLTSQTGLIKHKQRNYVKQGARERPKLGDSGFVTRFLLCNTTKSAIKSCPSLGRWPPPSRHRFYTPS